MPLDLGAWLFRSNSFCCCIPVRAGFVLISVLTFLLSGTISTIIWFEIFHSYQLSSKEHAAFVLTGIVETFLFLASIIGFIGAIARKQLFVMIYTYFLCVHFLINIIVGIYFLVTVRASNRQQLVDYCAQVFTNTSMESNCPKLMNVSTYVFIAIVGLLLLLELYGTLIAIRYLHRLRSQKRDNRARRLGYFHALSVPPHAKHARQASDSIQLLHSRESTADPQYFEGSAVFDIRARAQPSARYLPVSTYDRDLPPLPNPSPPLSPPSSPPNSGSDTSSARRVRALPPRPLANISSHTNPSMSSSPEQRPDRLRKLPSPHPPTSYTQQRKRERASSDSDDERQSVYTAEVSTNAHSALMDHAAFMHSVFIPPPSAPPVPPLTSYADYQRPPR